MRFYHSFALWLVLPVITACSNHKPAGSQSIAGATMQSAATRSINEPCEDCDLMFVDMPIQIDAIDTSAGWEHEGQRLIIKGTVYKRDQKTPAKDVTLYYYHTDKTGRYTPKPAMSSAARRHGYLRGWVKTDVDGQYAIYTSRPAQYPGGQVEAHIHVIVKEADMSTPYWIDAWIFDEDPLVTPALRTRLQNRGGNGILSVRVEKGVQLADHNVILGLNIPGYPD